MLVVVRYIADTLEMLIAVRYTIDTPMSYLKYLLIDV